MSKNILLSSGIMALSLSSICFGHTVDWAQRSSPVSPTPREQAVMTYDSARQEIVLFGGICHNPDGSITFLNDTWVWSGASWLPKTPVHVPPARGQHAMVYDDARREVLMFGGWNATGFLDDFWAWDGEDWRQIAAPNPPSPRIGARMVFNPAGSTVLLFAGAGPAPSSHYNDTWIWNGVNWTELHPASQPPVRYAHGMVNDPARAKILMFGGQTVGWDLLLNDTWEWDGGNWLQLSPAVSATARTAHGMVYDTAEDYILLNGGLFRSSVNGETWIFKEGTWSQLTTASTPPPRGLHAMAYDTARGQTVIFGGRADNDHYPPTELGDTWVLGIPDTTPPTVTCSASPAVLWPPNKKMTPVSVTVNIADEISGPAGLVLVSASSSEPDNDAIQGFVVGTASTSGRLKADRLGTGEGRVYRLVYQGMDRAGNSARCTATVIVPHDMSGNSN